MTSVVALLAVLATSAVAEVQDPSLTGPYEVSQSRFEIYDSARDRLLVTEVWLPVASRRFPLVLVAHGNCGSRTNYEYLSVAIASRGYVVAAPDFPGVTKADCDANGGTAPGDLFVEPPRDLQFLRGVLHERDVGIGYRVRSQRTGLVGHSLGGAAATNASIADRRFTAVALLAPFVGGAAADRVRDLRPRRAFLVVGGTADTTVPISFFMPFFDGLSFPSFLVTIVGGTHSGFTDMDSSLTPAQLARQQDLTRRYVVAFLERYLGRNRPFGRFLTPDDATAEGADVTLTARLP